jgi:hypothetical protein
LNIHGVFTKFKIHPSFGIDHAFFSFWQTYTILNVLATGFLCKINLSRIIELWI